MPQYVCRACRAHATRQFHSSRPLAALPFFQRIQETLFPSKSADKVAKEREEQQKKVEERAKRDAARSALEVKVDRKGREYEVAAVVDPQINPEYVMSTQWDGLRRIGSEKWVKERRDVGEKYVGFVPEKRMSLTNEQWEALIHHIAVEVLALRDAGRDVNDVCWARNGGQKNWRRTRTTTIVVDDANGNTSLRYGLPSTEQEILSAIQQAEAAAQVIEAEEAEEIGPTQGEIDEPELADQKASSNPMFREALAATRMTKLTQYPTAASWLSMRLENPAIKLAIVKRIMQLTGHRIPDPAISNSKTLSDLYTALKTKEPPKKLAKSPELMELNRKFSNVEVHPVRQTPIHKEKRVGRWKIIEDELIARDLPVTGSRWQNAKPRIGTER